MEKTDVLVIGGSASGIIAAVTAKSYFPDKEVLIIRKEERVLVPCGIPYIFGSLKSSEKNLIPDGGIKKMGINLKIAEVVSIDKEEKTLKTKAGDEIGYEKLVFATGSIPVVPKWLKGAELKNVFSVLKDKVYLDKAIKKLEDCKKIIVIGGGFIGAEISDELNKCEKEVILVELLPHILNLVFDDEICQKAEEILTERGVHIRTGVGVKEIIGDKKVSGVLLNNGEKIEADAVILSIGYVPNTELAKNSGIKINEKGFIRVDEYMRTDDDPDIIAVGDCAEKRDFITRKISMTMLASTGCAEARIAGMNLYSLSAVKTFGGTIAIFATAFGDIGFGAAGLNEKTALKEGFSILTGSFEGVDKHPGTLPGTNKQLVKLIASKESGLILGGEVVGGSSTGELTNIIGLAIQNKMTVNTILTSQIGTHPLLTAPPTKYPLIEATKVICKQMRKK